MARKENRVQRIVRLTVKRFPSFGSGSNPIVGNPLSHGLRNESPSFAAGVDIEQVVRFILAKRKALEYAHRQKIGNDSRDIAYTSGLLNPLSNRDLGLIIKYLNQREIGQRLRRKDCPFSGLSKKTREKLLQLPVSWMREGAQRQLYIRKLAISV